MGLLAASPVPVPCLFLLCASHYPSQRPGEPGLCQDVPRQHGHRITRVQHAGFVLLGSWWQTETPSCQSAPLQVSARSVPGQPPGQHHRAGAHRVRRDGHWAALTPSPWLGSGAGAPAAWCRGVCCGLPLPGWAQGPEQRGRGPCPGSFSSLGAQIRAGKSASWLPSSGLGRCRARADQPWDPPCSPQAARWAGQTPWSAEWKGGHRNAAQWQRELWALEACGLPGHRLGWPRSPPPYVLSPQVREAGCRRDCLGGLKMVPLRGGHCRNRARSSRGGAQWRQQPLSEGRPVP